VFRVNDFQDIFITGNSIPYFYWKSVFWFSKSTLWSPTRICVTCRSSIVL